MPLRRGRLRRRRLVADGLSCKDAKPKPYSRRNGRANERANHAAKWISYQRTDQYAIHGTEWSSNNCTDADARGTTYDTRRDDRICHTDQLGRALCDHRRS